MKIVISENQYQRLIEAEKEPKILKIPSIASFNNDWFLLQKFLEKKGNPPYTIGGDLNLREIPIESLGNLQSVGDTLYLQVTPLSKMYTEEQIREMVDVGGEIYL